MPAGVLALPASCLGPDWVMAVESNTTDYICKKYH